MAAQRDADLQGDQAEQERVEVRHQLMRSVRRDDSWRALRRIRSAAVRVNAAT